MEYKGYKIYADVSVIQKWSIQENQNGLFFCQDVELTEPLIENIDCFTIDDAEGWDMSEEFPTIDAAKKHIDHLIENK